MYVANEWLKPLVIIAVMSVCLGCDYMVEGCEEKDGLAPVCGLQAPEDLAVLPGGKQVLVSQFGGLDGSLWGRIRTLRCG